MKTLIAAVAVMMIALSFGVAYAIDDQMPMEFGISNLGTVVHDPTDWSVKKGGDAVISFTDGDVLIPLGPSNDIGAVLARESAEMSTLALTDKREKAAAAGGVAGLGTRTENPGNASSWYGLAY
jgi:hypothetical protein